MLHQTPPVQDSLTHTDRYMDDIIFTVQGGPEQQQQVFDVIVSRPCQLIKRNW